ncbi:flagellar biosynthesis protein FlgL [Erythrobacter sp. KY5]|uniref:flagellin N-terminal helical domain-containing protein n=1 Tax=Erythrobacter sp. KY5 TaxID=2011159 RepID=UPI000DBEFA5A|nr:flagellar biosynthesis protein FlgL [Erythrobacter sp. KY5]AWW73551.1 flagellar biosynthesis protein FlgL [Erythrobacter sp. KY5]
MSFVSNSTGAFFERSLTQMGTLRERVERLQTQIATGVRIERGSDDPVAASRLRALARLETRGATEAENAARLEQDLAEAGNQIEGVLSVLQRARELAVLAANDPTGETGREAIAEELDQMTQELFARSNALSLTGAPLFAGTAGASAFVRDANGDVTYNGNSEVGTIPVAPRTEIERGVTGAQVFEFEVNGAPSNSFAVLTNLAIALRASGGDPAQAARDALAGIDAAIDTANRSQTVIGTRAGWVEAVQQDQQTRAIDVAEKRSQIADTDVADTIVRLQQALTALEASQASFTRVSSLTLFNAL